MSDDKPDPTPDPAAADPADRPQPETPTPMPKPRTPNLALRRLRAGFKPSRGQAIVAVAVSYTHLTLPTN